MNSVGLSLFFLNQLVTFFGFLFLTFSFRKVLHQRFSFTRMFSFELMEGQKKGSPWFSSFWFIFLGASWVFWFIDIFPFEGSAWTLPLIMLMILFWMLITLSSLVQPKPIERFLFLHTALHVVSILFPLIVSIFSWTTPFDSFTSFLPWASSIFTVINLLLVFLPQLKNWSQLKKVEVQGNVEWVRPQFFILALYEWWYWITFYGMSWFIFIEIWV